MEPFDENAWSFSSIEQLELLGEGIRSSVYALDDETALKVYVEGVPTSWSIYEARLTNLARACGAPAPDDVRAITIDGRAGLIMERIRGESLWKWAGRTDVAALSGLGVTMAEAQLGLGAAQVSLALPHQWDRLKHKVDAAVRRFPRLEPSLALMGDRSHHRVDRLCHGDLHMRNVLRTDGGTVMVDWFDVNRGELVVAVARTLVLFESETTAIESAPMVRAGYLEHLKRAADVDLADLERWVAVQWVARLAEGLDEHRLGDVVEMVHKATI